MSNQKDKVKSSKRRHNDEVAIKKQVKIAKSKGLGVHDKAIKEPHRMAKHHAMDCGRPGCMLCGNPRKIFKEVTPQEKKLFQDLDSIRDKHSNGLINGDKESNKN